MVVEREYSTISLHQRYSKKRSWVSGEGTGGRAEEEGGREVDGGREEEGEREEEETRKRESRLVENEQVREKERTGI